jgi:hypothetical protein
MLEQVECRPYWVTAKWSDLVGNHEEREHGTREEAEADAAERVRAMTTLFDYKLLAEGKLSGYGAEGYVLWHPTHKHHKWVGFWRVVPEPQG